MTITIAVEIISAEEAFFVKGQRLASALASESTLRRAFKFARREPNPRPWNTDQTEAIRGNVQIMDHQSSLR